MIPPFDPPSPFAAVVPCTTFHYCLPMPTPIPTVPSFLLGLSARTSSRTTRRPHKRSGSKSPALASLPRRFLRRGPSTGLAQGHCAHKRRLARTRSPWPRTFEVPPSPLASQVLPCHRPCMCYHAVHALPPFQDTEILLEMTLAEPMLAWARAHSKHCKAPLLRFLPPPCALRQLRASRTPAAFP